MKCVLLNKYLLNDCKNKVTKVENKDNKNEENKSHKVPRHTEITFNSLQYTFFRCDIIKD